MKRRNFIIGGIAASAAVRAWPFRVYSFPSQIIPFDYLAEKEKYIQLARAYIDRQITDQKLGNPRLARAYIDQQVTKYGILRPSPDGRGFY